jgi:hypothetical protein
MVVKYLTRKRSIEEDKEWLLHEETLSTSFLNFHRLRLFRTVFDAVLIGLVVFLAGASIWFVSSRISILPTNSPRLFKPTSYDVVPGFFAQSLNSTDDGDFDFVKFNKWSLANTQSTSSFGLLNERGSLDNSTDRWVRFEKKITELNLKARPTEAYKGKSARIP